MKAETLVLLTSAVLAALPMPLEGGIVLGSAGDYSALAGSAVTNIGLSVLDGGHLGVSPGSAITGFPPGILLPPFEMHAADANASQAQRDLAVAYEAAAGMAPTQDLSGQDLGGLELFPGVYHFSTAAQLTGTLTLNNLGDPDAQFVFQIGSTLITASDSAVVTINGGSTSGNSVFWQIGSSATLAENTAFEGHLLAFTSIDMSTGASILQGSALARNGAVTLNGNRILNTVIPEPGTLALAMLGAGGLVLRRRHGDESGGHSVSHV